MPVTMSDVAKRAGVSKATVSRVLNGYVGHASEETIAQIYQAVEDLGYVPNRIAANLKKKNTMSVGLVLADVVNPFFSQIAQGVEDVLRAASYSLLLANTDNDPEREVEQIRSLIGHQVDAIILASSFSEVEDHFGDALERDIDIVLVNNLIANMALDAVVADSQAGAQQAVGYLIHQGHRRIAMITGPRGVYSSDRRLAGYVEAHEAAGLAVDSTLILEGDFRAPSGYTLTRECLQAADPPTALFVSNNLMSTGALRALKELRVRIPDDISFIGFDDMEWYSLMEPAITSVFQPNYSIGATAAKRVLERLAESDETLAPEVITLETELIIRQSTKDITPGE